MIRRPPPIELTREALAVAVDIMVLPGNERDAFATALAARAAAWRACRAGSTPAACPIVVDVRQDPRCVAEKY